KSNVISPLRAETAEVEKSDACPNQKLHTVVIRAVNHKQSTNDRRPVLLFVGCDQKAVLIISVNHAITKSRITSNARQIGELSSQGGAVYGFSNAARELLFDLLRKGRVRSCDLNEARNRCILATCRPLGQILLPGGFIYAESRQEQAFAFCRCITTLDDHIILRVVR